MLFTLNVEFNGKLHYSGSLESDEYVYHMLVSDVCGIIQAGGQRIGNSIFLEGLYPQTGTWSHLEDDDDVQHLLNLNFDMGTKEVKVKMMNFTYTSLLKPLVSPGQDKNVPSDGDEQFLFSDTSEENDKEDSQPSISICEFSESSGGVLSDYDSENAENCIGIEEQDDDKVGLAMGKQADKLQGSYFKFTNIKHGDKIKEVVKFAVNQVFEDVDHFRSTLRRYAIEEGIKLVKVKNDKRRVTQKCSGESCPFRIHASLDYDGHTFRIKKLCDEHTCVKDIKGIGVSSLWIAEQFLEDFKLNINFTPEQMNDKLIKQYGIHVSSRKLYRAKEKGISLASGDYIGSYALIPRYGQAILDSNPQTWVKMKYSSIPNSINPIFDRIFISFLAQKNGFLKGCRPFIGLDGCFLKSPYGGQLLVAISLDANNGIFPVAVMICMEESFDTWSYFLEALTNYLGHDHHFKITFMSDRQKGLINAVKEKCPNSPQRHCARHLYANFRKKYPGVRLRQLFWKAVKSYNEWDFDDYMKEIKLVDSAAYKWLTNDCGAAIDTWARHKFDEAGISDHVTNNMCESFNAYLVNPRKQPILILLEFIRRKITKRFCTRYKKACNWSSPLPPKVMKRINQRYQEGRNLLAISTNEWTFQVEGDKRSYIVNLREKRCECREWLLTGIPCKHAMCCIRELRHDQTTYVHHWLSIQAYKDTYDGFIAPVQDKCMWREVESQWQPPKQSKKRGRPKMSRRKEQWEMGVSTSNITPFDKIDQPRSSHGRCGFCKELGHNRLTCPHISNEERLRKKATRKPKLKCAPSSCTHD